ncbi:MAG: PulJ/GspJ family protein [Gaiellaceae bacterium]
MRISPAYKVKRWARSLRDERGLTLIELLIVISLLGITTAMFAGLYGTTINRTSQVQAQNIAQTEIRSVLNQLVADLRNATTNTKRTPIVDYGVNSITFYSPDRSNTMRLRKIRYSLSNSLGDKRLLQRQVEFVTSYDADGYPVDPGNGGPIETLATVQAPLTGDPAAGGWAKGTIFKYCVQSPPNMTIDPSNATSPELITWNCQAPTSAAQVKTIVIRTVVFPSPTSSKYNYGAVATMRWNAS